MTEQETLHEQAAADVAAKAEERAALARAVREFDAAQARIEQHAERVYDEKRRGLILELLPVLDNLACSTRCQSGRTLHTVSESNPGKP